MLSANNKVNMIVGLACAEVFVLVFCSLCVRPVLSNSRGRCCRDLALLVWFLSWCRCSVW